MMQKIATDSKIMYLYIHLFPFIYLRYLKSITVYKYITVTTECSSFQKHVSQKKILVMSCLTFPLTPITNVLFVDIYSSTVSFSSKNNF